MEKTKSKMNNLNNKLRDWVMLKKLCEASQREVGALKRQTLGELYGKVKEYYHKYHCKFEYDNKPEDL